MLSARVLAMLRAAYQGSWHMTTLLDISRRGVLAPVVGSAILLCSCSLHAQVVVLLRDFTGWPVFGCETVDTHPPPVQVCFQKEDIFGSHLECDWVDPPFTRQIRCSWQSEYYDESIKVLSECCADTSSVNIYLELDDALNSWKGLRVGGQTLELTGRGQSFPFTPWLRTGPITVQAADLPSTTLTLSQKNWLGQVDDLYQLNLLELAHYRGRNVIFQWRAYGGGSAPSDPDPRYATPSGAPLDRTILREDSGVDDWAIAGGRGFRVPDSATLTRLFGDKVRYFVFTGAISDAANTSSDGTLLGEENGAIWLTVGNAKFQVPDPATQARLYPGVPVVALWNGAPDSLSDSPVDGTLLREEDGTEWVAVGGAKFHIPDPETYKRIFFPLTPFQVWNGAPARIPDVPVDGTLVREEDGRVWVIYGHAKFHVPDPATFSSLYGDRTPFQLWTGAISGLSDTPVDGTIFRDDEGVLWIVEGGAKLELPDATHNSMYPSAAILRLWNDAIRKIPNIPIDNTLLREQDGAIWVILGQARFHVPDPDTFNRFFPDGVPLELWNGAVNSIPTTPLDGTVFREESSNATYLIAGGKRFATKLIGSRPVHVVWDGALAQIPVGMDKKPGFPPRKVHKIPGLPSQ